MPVVGITSNMGGMQATEKTRIGKKQNGHATKHMTKWYNKAKAMIKRQMQA